jgi:putative transposase
MVIRKDQPFDGACYHIVLRGNNRAYVLAEDRDKQYFKHLLRRYKQERAFELFHYCLMDNHVHLILRTLRGNQLSTFMQGMSQSFTNHWKRTRGFVGCLWQGPYKRFLIQHAAYLLDCGRYVERNPVRAGMVTHPANYRWSSYRAYAHGAMDRLVDLQPEYLALHPHARTRRRLYRSYVEVARPYEQLLDQAFMSHTLRKVNPWQDRTTDLIGVAKHVG